MTIENPTLAVLRNVSNTRDFAAAPVPDVTVSALLEAARWSGSSRNLQPWHLVVVRDRQRIKEIAAATDHISWMADAPLLLVVVMANQHPQFDCYDEGRMTERVLIAAKSLGLGAGMGWVPAGEGRDAVLRIVGAPAGAMVRTVIAVGTPVPGATHRPTNRKPLAEFASRERYGTGVPV